MKKNALIFLLAIFVPSLILGFIALRTANEQNVIIERQAAALLQKDADEAAARTRDLLLEEQRIFTETVENLLAREPAREAADRFSETLSSLWPRAEIGFAVTVEGNLLSPRIRQDADNKETAASKFIADNSEFLSNRVATEVYQAKQKESEWSKSKGSGYETASKDSFLFRKSPAPSSAQSGQAAPAAEKPQAAAEAPPAYAQQRQTLQEQAQNAPQGEAQKQQADLKQQIEEKIFAAKKSAASEGKIRSVQPQNVYKTEPTQPALSSLRPDTIDFSQLISNEKGGIASRFVGNRLEILFWTRPDRAPDLVFGAMMNLNRFQDLWAQAVPPSNGRARSTCMALLNDRGQPVITSIPGFQTNWKRPFVATEIGELLPHWEIGIYYLDGNELQRSAELMKWILLFLITIALAAIAWGSYLVYGDTRRQLALAQKKTDFVSNVSHELKTPLTSIRMFAELLHSGRVSDPEKSSRYLRIITLEAERLTRLINNVLDFAKLDSNRKSYDKQRLDLFPLIERVWESQQLHLQEQGFKLSWKAGPGPYPIVGDEDSLSQILVNLFSNAEKYSPDRKEIELHTFLTESEVCISVLDRGLGVPAGCEEKIFEHFFRAHDQLSSGISGSGLGLTLALKMARDHGGTITHTARQGGGSNFTLHLRLAPT